MQSLFISNFKMRRFAVKVLFYFGVLLALLFGVCFVIPDASAKRTMLGAMPRKLACLDAIPGGRVVFVGGSGLGMGMVTRDVEKDLGRRCYNMGLHAGLGLIYQMKSILPHVRSGDVVVLVPEYANFDGSGCYGNRELVAMIADVLPEHRKLLDVKHWIRLSQFVCEYGADKLRRLFCPSKAKDESLVYDDYGDSRYGEHPDDEQLPFPSGKHMSKDDFSPEVLSYISDFKLELHERGVLLVMMPPAYQESSFNNQRSYISRLAAALSENGTPFVVDAERYALPNEFFRDTPYHLNMNGRRSRSRFISHDLLNVLGDGRRANDCQRGEP